jgi:hypothetical protein
MDELIWSFLVWEVILDIVMQSNENNAWDVR